MFEAPDLMTSKKTWYFYAVAQRFLPMPLSWRPIGVNLTWYVFDRGERASLVRLLRRRHLRDIAAITGPAARRMASLLDWVQDSACADRGVKNGLCHGCAFGHGNTSVMYKNILKAVRSARGALDKIMETLSEWIRSLGMSDEAFDMACVRRAWSAVGAKLHIGEALAHINLRWGRGSLRCHSRVLGMEDPFGHVGSLVLVAYRLSTFTTSRFFSLGGRAREWPWFLWPAWIITWLSFAPSPPLANATPIVTICWMLRLGSSSARRRWQRTALSACTNYCCRMTALPRNPPEVHK